MPESRCTRQEIRFNSRVGYKKSYEKCTYQRKSPSRYEKRRKRSWQRYNIPLQNKTELTVQSRLKSITAESTFKPEKEKDAFEGNPKELFGTSSESGHEQYTTKNNTENNTALNLNIRYTTQPPCSLSELGIVRERPKCPLYTKEESRIKTFTIWPAFSYADQNHLVNAGFFYINYGDTVRCFFCKGVLDKWHKRENPWIEHAKSFPECGYLQLRMGKDFINDVQSSNTTVDTSLLASACVSSYFEEPDSLLKEPSVRVLLNQRLDESLTLRAASLIKSLGGKLSSDAIKETVEELYHQEDLEEIKQLKKENNRLRHLMVCKICKRNDIQVVFLPCGQLVSCVECSLNLKDCPACSNEIIGIARVFINREFTNR